MSCQNIQANFDERLDGRLAAAQQVEFDAHIESCNACREQWQAYAAAWQTLARQESIEPSFGFVERTLRRLDEPTVAARPVFWRLPAFRWATLAGLVVVIGLTGLSSVHRAQDKRRAEVYAIAQQDMLEDFDVIAALDDLNGESEL